MVDVTTLIRAGGAISTLSRASNVVSVGLAANYANNNLKIGQQIKLFGNTPVSFNITGVIATVVNQANFTINQAGIDESASVVGTAGGDYVGTSSWEAGLPTDFVAATERHIAECYNDWATGLVDNTTIGGHTTNASYYPILKAAAGEDHQGLKRSGFYLTNSISWQRIMSNSDTNSLIQGIDFFHAAPGYAVDISGNGGGNIINACIFESSVAGEASVRGKRTIFNNCLALGAGDGFFNNNFFANHYYNCLANVSGTGFFSVGDDTPNGGAQMSNSVAFQCGTSYNVTMYTGATSEKNASSDAATVSPPGTSPILTNIVAGDFVDSANHDFRLLTGSTLIDVGADLSAKFTTDIAGTARALPWDVGIFDYIASGATYNLTIENQSAIALIIDAVIAQQKTLTQDNIVAFGIIDNFIISQARLLNTDNVSALSVVDDISISSSINLVINSLISQGVIDNVVVTIGNVYQLLLSNMTTVGVIDDVYIERLKSLSLDTINAAALFDPVNVSQVYPSLLDPVDVNSYVDDITLNQMRALSLDVLGSQAILNDIIVSSGTVYQLLCDALDASATLPAISLTQTKAALFDALNAVAIAGEISVSQLRSLLLDDLVGVGNLSDVSVLQNADFTLDQLTAIADIKNIIVTNGDFYSMVFDAIDSQASISDVSLLQLRNLVLDDLTAKGVIHDAIFLKKLPLQIILPSILSITETLMITSVTEQLTLKQIH